MHRAHNQNLQKQINILEEIVKQNEVIQEILNRAPELELPNWYLGAGCIAQTVWNYYHGFELSRGIKDCDLVYFDSADISTEAQEKQIERGKEIFKDLVLPVEIVNQARVHLWYEEECGRKINAYNSCEEAINEWPTTATGIGVKQEGDHFIVYAPYGLNDIFTLTLRPNKLKITEAIYLEKVERWTKVWPKLNVIPW